MFKKCNCCGKWYKDEEEFLKDTDFAGVIRANAKDEEDLLLLNCDCGSTLAICASVLTRFPLLRMQVGNELRH